MSQNTSLLLPVGSVRPSIQISYTANCYNLRYLKDRRDGFVLYELGQVHWRFVSNSNVQAQRPASSPVRWRLLLERNPRLALSFPIRFATATSMSDLAIPLNSGIAPSTANHIT